MNQKEIEAATIMLHIFLVGISFNFNANYHELEEITKSNSKRRLSVTLQYTPKLKSGGS